MKRFLFSLTFALLIPSAAHAGRVWLVIRNSGYVPSQSGGLEKIEMSDMKQCIEQGEKWRNMTMPNFTSGYLCIEGK